MRPHRAGATIAAGAVALGAAALAAVAPAFHALPLIAPDSASYLQADVGRTAAYPLLLHIVPLNSLPAVQLALMVFTAAWLAVEMVMPATASAMR